MRKSKVRSLFGSLLIVTAGAATVVSSCTPARYGVVRNGVEQAAEPQKQDGEISNSADGAKFGSTGVFHLGDALFNGSTCQPQLQELPLSGSKFNFTFTVTADATPVKISVIDLCGVDINSNMVSITGATDLGQAPVAIPVGATSFDFPGMTLSAGTYTLTIASGKNTDNEKFIIGNFDDFIVGQVQVMGNNIQGVSYSAE